jgi:hypothetical protein
MGTTKTALDAGSTAFVYVCAIEGFESLLTNAATTAAAVTAWAAATDYAAAIGGLFVSLDAEQSISPYDPFGSGGSCSLTVVPTPGDDTFGVATHRKSAGNSTELAATLDRNDTTVTVKSTAAFDSSGTIYIGTEAIGYTGKTSTTFTGCTRGKYSPSAATGSETSRFGQHHRVGTESDIKLAPVVSSQPRAWIGRRVEVWMHRVVAGVLDVKAEALLVWSGKIAEIRDDPGSFGTVVDLKHELDVLKEATVGRQMWNAKTKEGLYLKVGNEFRLRDNDQQLTWRTATSLDVVNGAPGNVNEISAGYYTTAELHSVLNSWFAAEKAAARIAGDYYIGVLETGAGWRTRIGWYITGVGTGVLENVKVAFDWTMPASVAEFFGFTSTQTTPTVFPNAEHVRLEVEGPKNSDNPKYSAEPPLKALFSPDLGASVVVDNEQGEFVDQFDELPSGIKPIAADGKEWGLFIFNDATLIVASYASAGGVSALDDVFAPKITYGTVQVADLMGFFRVPYDDTTEATFTVRQLLIFEESLGDILKQLCYSTGTEGYNHATYDVLPFGCGVGIPGALLGYKFETSVDSIPGADETVVVIIDKPTGLADLIQGDLMLRRAFPYWKDQALHFGAWRSPQSSASVATLSESNKAAPGGTVDNHRTATTQTDEWLRPIVKILYNRQLTDIKGESYGSSLTFEDRTSVDDMGGTGAVVTIKARNTYDENAATGAGIKALAPNYLATMPMFARPARKLTRSIDPRYFHSIAVGSVVLFSDEFARDPATGIRGITARPAIITKHRWNPGGLAPGSDKPDPPGGEVEMFFTDANATLSDALYAPAADLDDTATTGGFDAGYADGTRTIRCYAQRYTQTTEYEINGTPVLVEENADATFFAAGYKVRIIERDPVDPLSPTMWERVVESQSGNDIVLTVALSSPAWDNTKTYRVVFDDYDVAVTAQQLKTFQADDADGLILDSSGPFLYGSGSSDLNYESNGLNANVELVPNLVYADGAGRDVGHEHALIKQLDNFVDYKSAIQTPVLWNEGRSNDNHWGSYLLVAVIPVYLSLEVLSSAVLRELNVGIQHRSTSGVFATVRVTLARGKPISSSLVDVNRGTIYSEMTRTTSSSTWQTSSASPLDARVKVPATGLAYLLIECGFRAECRGIHQMSESIRTTEFSGI